MELGVAFVGSRTVSVYDFCVACIRLPYGSIIFLHCVLTLMYFFVAYLPAVP